MSHSVYSSYTTGGVRCSYWMHYPLILLLLIGRHKSEHLLELYLATILLLCSICERVTPRLSHANAAVVLSAVKVLMKLMELLPSDGTFIEGLQRKLAPPLG